MRPRPLLLVLLSLALATSLRGAVFIVPDDADFVRTADAIVIAEVIGTQPSFDGDGSIVTISTMRVVEVLKGRLAPHSQIQIAEPGGVVGTRARFVSGMPAYEAGERVVVFLKSTAGGWRTHDMALGKFTFRTDPDGTELLIRAASESHLIDVEGNLAIDPARRAEGFVSFIRDSVAGVDIPPRSRRDRIGTTGRRDYIVSRPRSSELSPDIRTDSHFSPLAYTMSRFRWNVFDGGGTVSFYVTGSQPGYDSAGAAQRAVAAWTNDPGSNVRLRIGGGSGNGFVEDGVNSIVFNSSTGVPAGAIGYTQVFASQEYTYKGEIFWQMVEADVVMRSGLSVSASTFDEALTHEVGHGIALRHSNEGTPSSSNAVMNSSVSGQFGASLGSWDREAVSHVYPETASCVAPAITSHPQSSTIAPGQSVTLSVSASGTSPLTYQWYRASSSGSVPVGNASTLTVAPSSTTTYFVYVSNACGTVASNAATVTVTSCSPAAITSQPTSRTITAGQSTTLSVTASGTSPFSYQWYRSDPGGSVPVGTGSSLTVAPSSTSTYFVYVYNACGTAVSNAATVTVNPACTPPSITSNPANRTIAAGQSTTLSVTAAGSGPFTYQWYRSSASGSVAIGTNASSVTVTPAQTTTYFVYVYNACGQAVSNAVTVTVTQSCSGPPTISSHPQSTTINRGQSTTLTVVASGSVTTYQWYRSDPSGSVPVGTNSSSLTVAPSATTSYFVWVYNPCGGRISNVATVQVR